MTAIVAAEQQLPYRTYRAFRPVMAVLAFLFLAAASVAAWFGYWAIIGTEAYQTNGNLMAFAGIELVLIVAFGMALISLDDGLPADVSWQVAAVAIAWAFAAARYAVLGIYFLFAGLHYPVPAGELRIDAQFAVHKEGEEVVRGFGSMATIPVLPTRTASVSTSRRVSTQDPHVFIETRAEAEIEYTLDQGPALTAEIKRLVAAGIAYQDINDKLWLRSRGYDPTIQAILDGMNPKEVKQGTRFVSHVPWIKSIVLKKVAISSNGVTVP